MLTRYRFVHNYRNHRFGAWDAGDEYDFDDDTAAFLLADSPGCIEPVTEGKGKDAPPVTRQVEETPQDRMQRHHTGRGRTGGGAMSAADSGALLKDK
jgi:hypothetical protein